MQNFDIESVLFAVIDTIFMHLDELYMPDDGTYNDDFILGEKTAYVDCLETIQAVFGRDILPINIEDRYPIS